jgi:ADP-heptose:LPS heptosyltransferase
VFVDPDGTGASLPTRSPVAYVRSTLRALPALLARCELLLCNDSGPMHLAALLGVPVVAIFGPTEPAWFGPRGRDHRLVIRDDVACRPCFDRCAFAEPHCMTRIGVDDVVAAVDERLAALLSRAPAGGGAP